MKHLIYLIAIVTSAIGLSSCMDSLTGYKIEYPEANASYVGTVNEKAPNDDGSNNLLDSTFKVSYTSRPSKQLKIALNGNDVGKYFTQGSSEATADIENIKQFFRQGKNTLSVEPLSFGPQIIFYLDMSGPDIIITEGKYSGDGTTVEIKGYLRDPSSFGDTLEVDLTQITGHDPQGNVLTVFQRTESISVGVDGEFSGTVNIEGIIEPEVWNNKGDKAFPVWEYIPGKSLLYTLKAKDVHGYPTSLDIIADVDGSGDSLPINNALRIAVGDTFVESLRPVIASALNTALKIKPLEGSNIGPFKVDIGMGNMPTTVNRFYMATGTEVTNPDPDSEIDWTVINKGKGPGQGTLLLNSFKIKEGGILAVDMVITSVLVDLTIELPSLISWLIPNITLGMYIDKIVVETDAIAQAAEGKLHVQLGESNFALQGIVMTETKAGSLDITAIAGALMPAIEGLIGGLLPTLVNPVLADNLSRLVIGKRLYRTDLIPANIDKDNLPNPDSETLTQDEKDILAQLEAEVPYTDFRLDVFELATGNLLGPGLPYDLLVGIQSKGDTGKSDAGIPSILGTYFNDDPIDPAKVFNSLGNSGTNISLAINSNLLNQFLAGAYSIGQMHLTLHNGTTYFGGDYALTPVDPNDPTKTLAKKNDIRTRLWPDMPPIFKMEEVAGSGGAGKASITYPSAVLAMEKYDGTTWKTDIELHVDFDLAILIDELDGAVTLGAAGPPIFNINKVVNNTNIQVPDVAIQAVLDAALFFGGDAIANEVIALNLNDIAEGVINGTQVVYLDSNDNYSLKPAEGESKGECAVKIEDGVWGKCDIGDTSCNPSDNILTSGSGGDGYDLICRDLNFVVQTDTVGVIGNKGSNLFFQMGARDPELPPAPAIPRFDLDDDGVIDYRDNCSLGQYDLAEVINSTDMSITEEVDSETGVPSARFEEAIRIGANELLASLYGASKSSVPNSSDVAWYNKMRKNDNPVTDLGTYPWLRMLYSNKNQYNSDKDRVGELCEDDRDRDGYYADNLPLPIDNCPTVANTDQKDTQHPQGVGDACNARTTFVMLRNLKSIEANGTALCLTHEAEANEDGNGYPAFTPGSNWVSKDMHVMLPCDDSDLRQRFYMSAVGGDLANGVEFYNHESKDQNTASRLAAYGFHERKGNCTGIDGTQTRSQDLRLVNRNDAYIKGQNDDIVDWSCSGSSSYDRADPIWYPRLASAATSINELAYPWYLDTKFNFGFKYYDGSEGKIGASCLTWTKRDDGSIWGVDLDSQGQRGACAEGYDWRWAIWVGGVNAPWNGEW